MNGCDNIGSIQKEMELKDKGFKHNLQGLRVACDLEQVYGEWGIKVNCFYFMGNCEIIQNVNGESAIIILRDFVF